MELEFFNSIFKVFFRLDHLRFADLIRKKGEKIKLALTLSNLFNIFVYLQTEIRIVAFTLIYVLLVWIPP